MFFFVFPARREHELFQKGPRPSCAHPVGKLDAASIFSAAKHCLAVMASVFFCALFADVSLFSLLSLLLPPSCSKWKRRVFATRSVFFVHALDGPLHRQVPAFVQFPRMCRIARYGAGQKLVGCLGWVHDGRQRPAAIADFNALLDYIEQGVTSA